MPPWIFTSLLKKTDMLARMETLLRRIRRSFSRSAWLTRLLHLPISEGSSTRPGLIMIQIDGLSQSQFERAVARGEMPFLHRLIQREEYQAHAHYSGLPATTPAVQSELFYGVKGAVPAFSFRDHESGQIVRMYEPEAAAKLEARHTDTGNMQLLQDGSAYSDNFTGGAAESHFCPSAMGWGAALRAANPLVLPAFLFTNLYSLLRVAVLLPLELGLALLDFARGLIRGHDVIKELKFIPTRIGICILLRELCVIGAKIDISRGLPIIHINLLGYDEQSHRRGPSSLFAHWTLKGIDDAILRLWRAANQAPWRNYQLWVYSDHGQVKVRPYHQVQGYSLMDAVEETFAHLNIAPAKTSNGGTSSIQTLRVRLLGGNIIQRFFAVRGHNGNNTLNAAPMMTALGPVAHVYVPEELTRAEKNFIATDLAQTHQVPVVLSLTAPGLLRAHTATAEMQLPQDLATLFGAEHPFIDALGDDLLRLCEHPDAGDFVLLGWRDGLTPLSFAEENGAHAGITPEETNGFALLPGDTPFAPRKSVYLRPTDLRNAALQHLGRPERRAFSRPRTFAPTQVNSLRVMTYNVHSCIGMDGKLDVERIARVIARAHPDVVALQELDVERLRTGGMDQAQLLARYLEMKFHFHPALLVEEERYGDAVLTHLPLRLVKAAALPGLADKPQLEPRGALWVAIEFGGREIQLINTHLGLHPRERTAQITALLGNDWLENAACREPVILCGDFNALPSSAACRRLAGRLSDVQVAAQNHRPMNTYSGRFPSFRIDHIFISSDLEVSAVEVPSSELARSASDHLPLLAEIRMTS